MSARQQWSDPAHPAWEELAVGAALSALEPEDEEAFAAHLRACARCERLVEEVRHTAAELAFALPQADPPERLRRAVTAIAGPSRPVVLPGPLRHRGGGRHLARLAGVGRLGRPWIALALGMVIVAGLSLWSLVLRSESTAATAELARLRTVVGCAEDPGCHQVRLVSSTDRSRALGLLVVRGDEVSVVADGLPVNDRTRTSYVLWQRPRDGSAPVSVGVFDVTCRALCVADGSRHLVLPYAATASFEVSFETSRTAPDRPSLTVYAVGTVAAGS